MLAHFRHKKFFVPFFVRHGFVLGGVLTSFNTIIVPYLSKFVKRF